VEAAVDIGPDSNVSDDISLWNETRERRNGTGETRRTLSWIWTTESHSANPEDDGDNVLQVEWAKSRARAARCREEVLLLREEMRRVLASLKWKSAWWLERQNSHTDVTSDHAEGLQAYAETQSDLQKSLKGHFCNIWKSPLADASHPLDDDGTGEVGGDNDADDDDDDDDDGEDGGADEDGLAEGSDEEGSDIVDPDN